MSSVVKNLSEKGLVSPPSWLPFNTHYEVVMGSQAYGVSEDASDFDVYGWCIPPKDTIFPHLNGHIPGFGKKPPEFGQFLASHITDSDALGGKGREYDVTIYSVVKFFQLCMENNPNMIDALFVPSRCVLHATRLGQFVRERRRDFLHKGCWHKFKGYAYSQLHRVDIKNPTPGSKRWELVQKHGFDTKFLYHVLRLLDEAEQILSTGDLDLERSKEQMKAVRRGEMSPEQVREYFDSKEKYVETLYEKSTLPWGPDEDKLKKLLLAVLEDHYGSLEKCLELGEQKYKNAVDEIVGILRKVGVSL